jgi:hypothetical protein
MRFIQAGRYRPSQYRPMPLGADLSSTPWGRWIGVGALATGGFLVLRYIYRHTIGDG